MIRTIAYVDHAVEVGGAEKSLCELIAHLDHERFRPVILHPPGAEWTRYAEGAGAELRPTVPLTGLYAAKRTELGGGAMAGARRVMSGFTPVARLWREFGRVRPALVHTNSAKMHLLAGTAARLRRLPLVWHMRDLLTEPGARAWLERAVRRLRPEVIAISKAVAAQFEGLPCRVHIIPNGIPLDRFLPGPAPDGLREQLGLPEDAPVAVIVGRLTPWKGHQTLLRAWREVVANVPQARLLIVGEVAFWEESYAGDLRALADDLGIAESVHWSGFREDVPDLLRLANLLVLASTDEPFGRVLIEAMAIGLPVVATASGGVPEIVIDGETGLLVPPGEPGALGDAIATLLANPLQATEMGAAGRRRALERFDVRRVAREVGQVYEEILR